MQIQNHVAVSSSKTIVVKLGTSVLTAGSKKLNRERMIDIVRQCKQLQLAGHRVVIVTSGAIAAGREYLDYPELPATTATKQLLAAVGQSRLIQLWEQLFAIYELHIGQMLLTRADIEDQERFLNARDTLNALLDNGIIPVINENDAVATAEIKVGDNDNLSALVSILATADQLLLLTDQKGLFTADPRTNPNATLISNVHAITDELRLLAGGTTTGLGTGGMATKLQAADVAMRAGVEVIIAGGSTENIIFDSVYHKVVGTRFVAQDSPIENRKRWIFGAPVSGKIIIDDGAVKALKTSGSSLLPKGIIKVMGDFSRGEVVSICSVSCHAVAESNLYAIARGVTRYNSDALRLIAGKHSNEILNILGFEDGSVAIHRDEMILS